MTICRPVPSVHKPGCMEQEKSPVSSQPVICGADRRMIFLAIPCVLRLLFERMFIISIMKSFSIGSAHVFLSQAKDGQK